jgi:hypothetical protein
MILLAEKLLSLALNNNHSLLIPMRYLVTMHLYTIFLLEEFEVGVGNVYSKPFMIVRPEYQWQYSNPTHGKVYNI